MFLTPDFTLVQDTSGEAGKKNRFISLVYRKETIKEAGLPKTIISNAIDQYKAIMYREDKKTGKIIPVLESGWIYEGRKEGRRPAMVLASLPDDTILLLHEDGRITKE